MIMLVEGAPFFEAGCGIDGGRSMATPDLAEQWSSMQKMFLPSSESSATLRENVFWESQDKVLDNMQALANAWFDRRHTGSQAAREAAERMCATGRLVDLIQAYQV